jgi:multidrug efflux pump subunit AcrA (membrane-fusion protein)
MVLLLGGVVVGCSKAKSDKTEHISLIPTVKIVQPDVRDIHRTIAQPGVIEPYEQTAIYSKVASFVQKWNVDIGAHVKKDDLLVELLVPELAEEHNQKEAQVEQQKAMMNQADKLVRVAKSNLRVGAHP